MRKEKYQIMPVEGSFALTPFGIIHSPFREHGDAPRQGRFSDVECIIETGMNPYVHTRTMKIVPIRKNSLLRASPRHGGQSVF
jgi:hypothetical protein